MSRASGCLGAMLHLRQPEPFHQRRHIHGETSPQPPSSGRTSRPRDYRSRGPTPRPCPAWPASAHRPSPARPSRRAPAAWRADRPDTAGRRAGSFFPPCRPGRSRPSRTSRCMVNSEVSGGVRSRHGSSAVPAPTVAPIPLLRPRRHLGVRLTPSFVQTSPPRKSAKGRQKVGAGFWPPPGPTASVRAGLRTQGQPVATRGRSEMSTRILSGIYGAGYTLAASYGTLRILGSAFVGGTGWWPMRGRR